MEEKKTISTVGELRKALEQYSDDMPFMCVNFGTVKLKSGKDYEFQTPIEAIKVSTHNLCQEDKYGFMQDVVTLEVEYPEIDIADCADGALSEEELEKLADEQAKAKEFAA